MKVRGTAKHPNSVPPQILYPPGPIERQANTVLRGMLFGGGGLHIYYYTPLPLNLANKQQRATTSNNNNNKHVTIPFWPLHLPNAPGLTLL